MSGKIVADDGLIATVVGKQTKEKHEYLRKYIELSRGARKRYIGAGKAGATFVDLFCGPGRSYIKDTNEWVDGSAVVAWKESVQTGAPFSDMYVGDLDEDSLNANVQRLRVLGAPVVGILGSATDTVKSYVSMVSHWGLHFAFVDPYNLGTLDFSIIQELSKLKRPDMLIHVSKMDLQRNLEKELANEKSILNAFVPNWQTAIDIHRPQLEIRRQVMNYWQDSIGQCHEDLTVTEDPRLVTGEKNQPLYWLYLVAKHSLAQKFWKIAGNGGQQNFSF